MTALGIWLAALGAADLVLAPSGRPARGVAAAGAAIAAGVAAGAALLFGLPALHVPVLVALAAGSAASWVWARSATGWSPGRAAFVLAGAGGAVAAMIVTAALWEEPSAGVVGRWLGRTPLPPLQDTSTARLALVVGAVLVLCGTANAVVRLVLEAAEALPREREEPPLAGGRAVGILERLLIFGFIVAGAPAAAALVASAKSVLRFPEISHSGTEIHVATEYFLVGSLTSWLLAAAVAALVAA